MYPFFLIGFDPIIQDTVSRLPEFRNALERSPYIADQIDSMQTDPSISMKSNSFDNSANELLNVVPNMKIEPFIDQDLNIALEYINRLELLLKEKRDMADKLLLLGGIYDKG